MQFGRLVVGAAVSMLFACGSPDEHPFGGPYGGTSPVARPGTPASSGSDPSGGSQDPPVVSPPGVDGGSPTPTPSPTSTTPTPGPAPDAGGPTPPPAPAAPTFTEIYTKYFQANTVGNCVPCHDKPNEMQTAASSYAYLQTWNQISGTTSSIKVKGDSILRWYGGTMPTTGATSAPEAQAAIEAWVAAGALNN